MVDIREKTRVVITMNQPLDRFSLDNGAPGVLRNSSRQEVGVLLASPWYLGLPPCQVGTKFRVFGQRTLTFPPPCLH